MGLLLLGLGRAWTAAGLESRPFFAYGMEWFLKLTPGETRFYLRFLITGIPAAGLLAYALAPAAERLARGSAALARRERVCPLLLAVAAAALTLLASTTLLRNQVVTDDEHVYLFQSRLLLAGHAAAPAPEPAEFLDNVFVVARDGRWFGQYPPGHPLALIPGVLLGLPRLTPILFAAANLLLTFAVLRRIAGPSWALAGCTLLLTSPLFLLTGATLLSHNTAYFGLALASWGALRAFDRGQATAGLVAGAGLGFLLLTRPYTAVTLGVFPAGLLAAAALRRRSARVLLAALSVGVLAGTMLLLHNRAVSGDPFVTGYGAVRGPGRIEFGFGPIVPGFHDHTPVRGMANAALLAVRFHFWSWGWPIALFPLVLIPRSRREDPVAWIALAALVLGLLSFMPYWSIGVADPGPVKTFELLLPAVLFTTLGMRRAARRWGLRTVAGAAGGSFLVAFAIFWPPQVQHLRELSLLVREPWAAAEARVKPPAVVFVDPTPPRPARSWVYGRPNPSPDLSDPILYVKDLGSRNALFHARHPERRPYRMSMRSGRPVIEPLFQEID